MPKSPHSRTGGQLVADALLTHGVERVFCVPGESYLEVLDGLFDHAGRVRVHSCRHEHGAANMAEAYGKLTGSPGVCLVTRGPGACNAAIGVHTAFQDSTPMLLLVGQVPRSHKGREAFQEVDYTQMFAPLAKWVVEAACAAELPGLISEAFQRALSGRPGPVVVALPEDVLRETTPPAMFNTLPVDHVIPDPACIEMLRTRLSQAVRPMMMLGGGGWTDQARKMMTTFAEANGLPVCTSFRRQDLFPNDHPQFAGEMGIAPNPKLVENLRASDVLLVVGARLGEMTSQGYSLLDLPEPKQTLIHVHSDERELGRVFKPELGIASGMSEFARAVAAEPAVCGMGVRRWAQICNADYDAGRFPPESDHALDLGACMRVLNDKLPDDAIVTVDAGNFSGWPQRCLQFGGGRRLLGPTSGAMGYAVPAAVAASAQHPDRVVVGCVGDGGFGMTGMEIATAVQNGLTPIILVFNNGMYGTIRMHQERRHPGRVIATGLTNPDFAAFAESFGATGMAVQHTADFAPAFDRAMAADGPVVIELRMDPDDITTRATLTSMRRKAQVGNA